MRVYSIIMYNHRIFTIPRFKKTSQVFPMSLFKELHVVQMQVINVSSIFMMWMIFLCTRQ